MFVSKIALLNYRNLQNNTVTLSPNINIFYGNNAQGKTNFLESIYLCGTGRSHRSHIDRELIRFNESTAHLQAFVCAEDNTDRIDIHLRANSKKGIAINALPIKKLGDLFGVLLIVIFSPEDLSLIKAGPAERRRFMDMELCQLSKVYYFELQQYYRILKQRNNLLKNIQKNRSLLDTLDVWDVQLIDHGQKIMMYRSEFLEKIDTISKKIHHEITSGQEVLKVVYKPSVLIEEYEKKMSKNIERDLLIGSTTFGIHKDDVQFYINDIDARIFGSQGQQRTTSLSLKLAEIELIKEEKNDVPVLLLDDVLSELDLSRQKHLLKSIESIQTIITCTGVEDVLNKIVQKSYLFSVKNGDITFENN